MRIAAGNALDVVKNHAGALHDEVCQESELLGKLFITHADCRVDPIDWRGDDISSRVPHLG